MTFLPIVRRELLVASRRRATFRVRRLGALIAVVLGGLFMLPHWVGGTSSGGGAELLRLLGALGLLLALLSGPMLTADSLSRERREGTLGFLFLTDLRGYDIVAGKLVALVLIPLHGLLATFPIAALTLCLGGVTAGEFWRLQGLIANALFLSMSIGLWVSSIQTEDRRAVGWTACILLSIAALPPLVGSWLARMGQPWTEVPLQAVSPALLFSLSGDQLYQRFPRAFWGGLAIQHALAWVALVAAAIMAHRSWRLPAREGDAPTTRLKPADTAGAFQWMATCRPRFADGPLAWLAERDPWLRRSAWWVATGSLALAVMVIGSTAIGSSRLTVGTAAATVLGVGQFILKFLLATQAVYFLNDACRNGTMEMLLITPVTDRQFLRGHFAGLRRTVLGPFLVLAAGQVGMGVAGRLLAGGDWPTVATQVVVGAAPALFTSLVHALDLVAVAIHASRWALFYDRPSKALLRTSLLIVVLPTIFCNGGRLLIDLIAILNCNPVLLRFRDLVVRWYFPGQLGPGFGPPRAGA
ncbi:MAG: ABC transporter permease subunit [Verrucomicrobiales bacterium]|nr:ABC transporter permease subunit [Verrucomicrobiales bacterium]